MDILPIEVIDIVEGYCDYKSLCNLRQTSQFFYTKEHNIKEIYISTNENHLKDIDMNEALNNSFLNTLNVIDCNKINSIIINNQNFINNDIHVYNLFKKLSNYRNLKSLTIKLRHQVKGNNLLSILYLISNYSFLSNLYILDIPNIYFDGNYYPNTFLKDEYITKLENVQQISLNFKSKYNYIYLSDLSKKITNLHILSRDTNIFNNIFTTYNKLLDTYNIKKYIDFPNLSILKLSLNLSEIKSFIFALSNETKRNIKHIIFNYNYYTSYSEIFRVLNKLNDFINLSSITIENILCYENEKDNKIYPNNFIDNLKIMSSTYNNLNNIDLLNTILDIIPIYSNLHKLGISLYRPKYRPKIFKELKHKATSLSSHFSSNLETLIIYDINLISYVYLISFIICKIKSIKYVIFINNIFLNNFIINKKTHVAKWISSINKFKKNNKLVYFHNTLNYLIDKSTEHYEKISNNINKFNSMWSPNLMNKIVIPEIC